MLLLKRIVLHLSMVFCLTGFVCQPAFVRARQKPREGEEEKYGGETTTLSSLPDARLPPRRDKRKSQRVHSSEIIFPHSSPIFLRYLVHLHGRYTVVSLREVGESGLTVASSSLGNS